MNRYCGRDFTPKELELIRSLIKHNPNFNRTQLSVEVCRMFQWFKPDGKLKDMSCRVAMLRMNKDGLIQLPPSTRTKKPVRKIEFTPATEPKNPVVELPIQPHWVGKLPNGLVMNEAMTTPATVKVTGGGLVLRDISTIFTEQVPLDKLTESGTIMVGLVQNSASLHLETKDKIQINYRISKRSSLF